ncbi:helix-turn-helix domain-containing protein [Saccharothrix lopnurensis]|uniref:Helix-turn-helix domain-containing protein n=1 Tax=Saccharothrix lopnurensis TaxID=1670621 RepID=A0ABW1P7L5_9PSEU
MALTVQGFAWHAAKVTANPPAEGHPTDWEPVDDHVVPTAWGPISGYVAANVLRLRTARGMSTTRLSAALKDVGHSIAPTAITRIEKGQRRVDVDDLVALGVALKVSPMAFLLPPTMLGEVELTPGKAADAVSAWMWITAQRPLDLPKDGEARSAAMDDHQVNTLPPPLRRWSVKPDESSPGVYVGGKFHPLASADASEQE